MKLPVYVSGDGPRVVLVHGRASHHETWEPTLPALAGYQAVRVDLPGHGRAPAPRDPEAYRLEAQTDALAETLADLPGRFVLVGHSMGGWVSLRYALRHPERLEGLVLEATSAASPFRGGRHRRLVEQADEQVRLAEEEGLEALCRYLEARDELLPVHRQRLLMMQPHAYVAVMRACARMEDLQARLPAVRLPSLVFCGLEDTVFEPECRCLAERIPGARGVFLPGVGHSPHGEAPEAYGAALRQFLAEYLGPPATPGGAGRCS